MIYTYDVSEGVSGNGPTLAKASLQRMMEAVVVCNAQVIATLVQGRSVVYRIRLIEEGVPEFQRITGYRCDLIDEVGGSDV